jgi:parallel beta-helix repeat protein
MLAGIGGLAAGALLVGARSAHAGPLNPPDGPITSTYKTLDEVEPRIAINAANTPGDADSLFKITAPGSYYLTGNITGVPGKHGIEIAASGVTLDLNGFDLVGVPGMGAFSGVIATVSGLRDIALVNGSVRNWGADGVLLAGVGTDCIRIERLSASNNAGSGIAGGTGSVIVNCTAHDNGNNGLFAASGSTVSYCTTSGNQNNGIGLGDACTVSHCTGIGNDSVGIRVGSMSTMTSCVGASNGTVGLWIAAGCTMTNCSAYDNIQTGISVSGLGCIVSNCTASRNDIDGISNPSSGCIIADNTCWNNGLVGNGAGIRVTGSDNRIQGNNCTNADLGIVLLGAGNVMVKNTCSGNTINYDIFAGNRYGPIINITAANPATVSGNSAASTMGSTDPWANFAY